MRSRRDAVLGSTGCQPVAFGGFAECPLARSAIANANAILCSGSRLAAANYRLAACAPQKQKRQRCWYLVAFALLLLSNFAMLAQNEVVDLALPTDNDGLLRGGGPQF